MQTDQNIWGTIYSNKPSLISCGCLSYYVKIMEIKILSSKEYDRLRLLVSSSRSCIRMTLSSCLTSTIIVMNYRDYELAHDIFHTACADLFFGSEMNFPIV